MSASDYGTVTLSLENMGITVTKTIDGIAKSADILRAWQELLERMTEALNNNEFREGTKIILVD